MNERGLRWLGVVVTVVVHVAVVFAVMAMHAIDRGHAAQVAAEELPKLSYMEAGLAVKEKHASGPKSKQPQKPVASRIPGEAPIIPLAPDPSKASREPAEKEDYVKDWDETQRKARALGKNVDSDNDGPTTSSGEPGPDHEDRPGRREGSEHGTLMDPKGHPYVGELHDLIYQGFEVPTMVAGRRETRGCVRMSRNGRIAEYMIDPSNKSGDARFDGAVEKALIQARNSIDLDDVPAELQADLIKGYGCFPFTSDD